MGTDATGTQILDAFATYEMQEMAATGLTRAYGATTCITSSGTPVKGGFPDALAGQLPCALGWIDGGDLVPETEGGTLGNGQFEGRYIVHRWYAVANDSEAGWQIAAKALPYIEKPVQAIVAHFTLGGIVARLRPVPPWKLAAYQVGDDIHVGPEHTWEVTTYPVWAIAP